MFPVHEHKLIFILFVCDSLIGQKYAQLARIFGIPHMAFIYYCMLSQYPCLPGCSDTYGVRKTQLAYTKVI